MEVCWWLELVLVLNTNTRHIYYDVKKPYKDAYRYQHIHKGYRGQLPQPKLTKALSKQENYKKVPERLCVHRRHLLSPDPIADELAGTRQAKKPPSAGPEIHRTQALRGATIESRHERERNQSGASAGDTPHAILGLDLTVPLRDGERKSQIDVPVIRKP
jgi:hypothetical protein